MTDVYLESNSRIATVGEKTRNRKKLNFSKSSIPLEAEYSVHIHQEKKENTKIMLRFPRGGAFNQPLYFKALEILLNKKICLFSKDNFFIFLRHVS
jgi:hypothetical protein